MRSVFGQGCLQQAPEVKYQILTYLEQCCCPLHYKCFFKRCGDRETAMKSSTESLDHIYGADLSCDSS